MILKAPFIRKYLPYPDTPTPGTLDDNESPITPRLLLTPGNV